MHARAVELWALHMQRSAARGLRIWAHMPHCSWEQGFCLVARHRNSAAHPDGACHLLHTERLRAVSQAVAGTLVLLSCITGRCVVQHLLACEPSDCTCRGPIPLASHGCSCALCMTYHPPVHFGTGPVSSDDLCFRTQQAAEAGTLHHTSPSHRLNKPPSVPLLPFVPTL